MPEGPDEKCESNTASFVTAILSGNKENYLVKNPRIPTKNSAFLEQRQVFGCPSLLDRHSFQPRRDAMWSVKLLASMLVPRHLRRWDPLFCSWQHAAPGLPERRR